MGGKAFCYNRIGVGREREYPNVRMRLMRPWGLGPRVVHATKRMKLSLFGLMLYKNIQSVVSAANIIQACRRGKPGGFRPDALRRDSVAVRRCQR